MTVINEAVHELGVELQKLVPDQTVEQCVLTMCYYVGFERTMDFCFHKKRLPVSIDDVYEFEREQLEAEREKKNTCAN